jgi:hypothetical protein
MPQRKENWERSYEVNIMYSKSEKYWALRTSIGKYSPLPDIPPDFPNATEKGELGRVRMR